MNKAKQQIQWPEHYAFDGLVCTPDTENEAAIISGGWRTVVPVRIEGQQKRYVAKILRQPSSQRLLRKRVVHFLRCLMRTDENSQEWRFLAKHCANQAIRHLLPRPLARGHVDGHKAILIERILWKQKPQNIAYFMRHATEEQKNQIRICLDEIATLFGQHHIVCNDLGAQNILVSDKSDKLSLVVIDGFGNNHLIPYPIFSKTLNARKIARRIKRIKQRLA